MHTHHLVVDGFAEEARALRQAFDRRMGDTLRGNPAPDERFIWDYWHVPDQFTYVRTHAERFFQPELLHAFHQRLRHWALETLGVNELHGSWLSYYIDGCEQRIHADGRNGAWAYVYSLTDAEADEFTGGETFLVRHEGAQAFATVARTAHRFDGSEEYFERYKPQFGRLIVFNSQLPHGVTMIRGTRDPQKSRIIIHGWLAPGPFELRGGLDRAQARPVLERAFDDLEALLEEFGRGGFICTHLRIRPEGTVDSVRFLSNTVLPVDGEGQERTLPKIADVLQSLRFPAASETSELILPLHIE